MESKYEPRITNHEPSPLTKGLGESRIRTGSALILVVVLTSLLAIVGVMFVMVARVDRIATSAISENKTLDYAVEAVIARISQELVLDVPGVAGAEYYDYPGQWDRWLASLEPHKDGGYKWRQISDVTGFLKRESYAAQNVEVELPDSQRPKSSEKWVRDYPEIRVNSDGKFLDKNGDEAADGLWADADGDGVADSKWIELDDITSNKGKPIYAAIRVIDNGGMLNVNTAYKFDPTKSRERIDGSSQTQINLAALSQRGANGTLDNAADDLQYVRCGRGSEPYGEDDIPEYERDVVWRYYQPAEDTKYTPFDISDELELRNRFILNHSDIDTRIETVWTKAFRGDHYLYCPIGSTEKTVDDWLDRACYDVSDPNANEYYSYRHIATTYNMDRIIRPDGGKMVNVNRDGAGLIYSAIGAALFTADPNFKDIDEIAAQTAVNLKDFRDNDSNVTPLPDVNGITYYGFEQPCIYISEVAHKFEIPPVGPIGVEIRGYVVELYKPYSGDKDPSNWRLVISGPPPSGGPIGAPVGRPRKEECDIDWSGSKQFYVIQNDPHKILPEIDSDAVVEDSGALVFSDGDLIELQRRVDDVNITVDSIEVTGWLVPEPPVVGTRSFKRDINRHKCIRRLWGSDADEEALTLGRDNSYIDPNSRMIQAHPENRPFTNVGEIGMVFRKSAYGGIGPSDTEADVRLDLADPNYHNIFKYLTVFDPSKDGINNDGDGETPSDPDGWIDDEDEPYLYLTPEWKIPGRININTAPWYVIAQLPWVTNDTVVDADRYKLAQAIVAYRDKLEIEAGVLDYSTAGTWSPPDDVKTRKFGMGLQLTDPDVREEPGFAGVAELLNVTQDLDAPTTPAADPWYDIRRYGRDEALSPVPLDFSPDIVDNDFEERDVIFARLSNLVTVRSDVFTAYILVRIGADGPQKRVMAILDRSNVYPPEGGKVRIVALHPVADPR